MTGRGRARVGVLLGGVLLASALAPATGSSGQADGATRGNDCPVARLVTVTAPKERVLSRGLTMRTWKDKGSQTVVIQIEAKLGQVRGHVLPAPPGKAAPVNELADKMLLAVNAGYLDETTGLAKGPLAGQGRLVAGKGAYQGKNQQGLTLWETKARFSKTRLVGEVTTSDQRRPLIGVNTFSALGKGLVLVEASALAAAKRAGQLPSSALAGQLSGGRLGRVLPAAEVEPQRKSQYLVTSNGSESAWLREHEGSKASATWRLVSTEFEETVGQVIPVGSAYTIDGQSRFGPCRAPSSWESRPRMAISVGADGRTVTIVAVRGPAIPSFRQYDSGATPADMAQAALALGMRKAYALDAGASLQVLDNTGRKPKLIDRGRASSFLWQRPVSAALGFSATRK